MEHSEHANPPSHSNQPRPHESPNHTALIATLHCLAGCAIGEVVGLVIGTALNWSNAATILFATALAFVSGFALTALPLLRRGYSIKSAARIAVAADVASITIMELVDNSLMMLIPGAMDAPVDSLYFWSSMSVSLAAGGVAAFPVNRWLIARGQGHAVVHKHH